VQEAARKHIATNLELPRSIAIKLSSVFFIASISTVSSIEIGERGGKSEKGQRSKRMLRLREPEKRETEKGSQVGNGEENKIARIRRQSG
jgi:hypothetical protein